jgi:hypothetical protein
MKARKLWNYTEVRENRLTQRVNIIATKKLQMGRHDISPGMRFLRCFLVKKKKAGYSETFVQNHQTPEQLSYDYFCNR